MQPLFAYNALIWKNTITILTSILFVVFLVRGLYLFAVFGKHLLKSNQGFQYQKTSKGYQKLFLVAEAYTLAKLKHKKSTDVLSNVTSIS